jgi:hypothetical protein
MRDNFKAPTRLKSKVYSALVARQREDGSLLSLCATKDSGRKLCVFEALVQIAPLGESVKCLNLCRVCHARVLGERIENAPVFWPGCPYAQFQNR